MYSLLLEILVSSIQKCNEIEKKEREKFRKKEKSQLSSLKKKLINKKEKNIS